MLTNNIPDIKYKKNPCTPFSYSTHLKMCTC